MERYEKENFQRTVRETFANLKEQDMQNPNNIGYLPWHVIDARKSKDELHLEISTIVAKIVKDVENQPLKKLWVD